MRRLYLVGVVLVAAGLAVTLILSTVNVRAQDGGDYTWSGDVDAPDFPAGVDWINVSEPLTMADLRGKIVLLDFWTYGCINCIHIIPDLKRLEAEYADALVVVGVHSAKFDNEGETENIRRIVRRYEVEHPVLNDNAFVMWQAYGVQAWPTVMVIDPLGKVVGQLSGEPLYDRIQPIIDTMAQEYGASGVIDPSPLAKWQPELAALDHTAPLRFPGKVLADSDSNRLFISDSNHNRIVVSSLDTFEVLDVIGGSVEGLADGDFETARFFRPQGMTLVGNTLYVADTENHAIRAIDFDTRTVTTVAGTGEQGVYGSEGGPGPKTGLNSPWDVVAYDGRVYIAMAGSHQLWVYDIAGGDVRPYAGNRREALVDGKLSESSLNQPSGIETDGTVLYFADAEASAIRTADLDPDGDVKTIVGTGLFDFGDQDGVGDEVLLQHALGITLADDGYLYVADTYNNKIKRIDPESRESVTFLGTGEEGFADGDQPLFYEPGGIDFAGGKLYIADTNNHAIRVADLETGEVSTVEFANADRLAVTADDDTAGADSLDSAFGSGMQQDIVPQPPQTVAPGEGTLVINVTMPEGYKLNDQAPFTAIWPEDGVALVPDDARDIRIIKPDLPLEVPVTFSEGQTELAVDLTVYWCEAVNETLCFVDRVELVAPVTVTANSTEHHVLFERDLVPPSIDNSF
ncbi:MAG: redoxin domain-containing protein [Anaerolineae bacterium]|nr:redoxin domain-containing protein [Anaerolineae bacterium]